MTPRVLALLCVWSIPALCHAQEPLKPRLDDNGAPLPRGVIAHFGSSPSWVGGGFNVIEPSPDGKTYYTATFSNEVRDADTNKVLFKLEPREGGNTVFQGQWSSDGKRLVVLRHQAGFQLWDTTTRKPLWPKPQPDPSRDWTPDVRFMANDKLFAAVYPPDFFVEIRDVATGAVKQTWKMEGELKKHLDAFGDRYAIRHVMLSPSGEKMAWLATSPKEGSDCGMLVYETQTGKLLRSIKGLPYATAFDLPDEDTIVLHPFRPDNWKNDATYYSVIGIADGKTRFRCEYRGPPALHYGFDLELGGRYKAYYFLRHATVIFQGSLLTRDALGMIRWDAATGKKLDVFHQNFKPMKVSANGKRLLVCSGQTIRVIDDLEKLRTNQHFWSYPQQIRFLPNGRVQAEDSGRIHVFDHRTGAMTIERGPIAKERWEQYAHFQGLENATDAWKLHPNRSADGKRVIFGVKDGTDLLIRWFDDATGKELGRYRVPREQTYPSDYADRIQWLTDDGTMFGYITRDSRLVRVDCASGKPLKTIGVAVAAEELKEKEYPGWKYMPGGKQFIIAQREHLNSILGWQEHLLLNHDGEVIRQFYLFDNKLNWLRNARVTPDGRFVAIDAIGAGSGRIYETATGGRLAYLSEGAFGNGYDFSPDGKLIATSHFNSAGVLIWDMDLLPLGIKHPAPPTNAKEAEAMWEALNVQDSRVATPAVRALAGAPELAIKLIKERLRGPDPKQVGTWIAKLDAEEFAERDAAEKELGQAGEWALNAINNALKKPLSGEQERRLDSLLERLRNPKAVVNMGGEMPPTLFGTIPSYMRDIRALAVLERIGTPEARKVVETIAAGDSIMLIVRDAKLILARWPEAKGKK